MARFIKKVKKIGFFESINLEKSEYPTRVYTSERTHVYVDSVDIGFTHNNNYYTTVIGNLTLQDLRALQRVIKKYIKVLKGHENL